MGLTEPDILVDIPLALSYFYTTGNYLFGFFNYSFTMFIIIRLLHSGISGLTCILSAFRWPGI